LNNQDAATGTVGGGEKKEGRRYDETLVNSLLAAMTHARLELDGFFTEISSSLFMVMHDQHGVLEVERKVYIYLCMCCGGGEKSVYLFVHVLWREMEKEEGRKKQRKK
jgi:hypothetical protein